MTREIIWWLPIVFWIAFTTYLWILASRVAKRDQVRLDNLELIWTAAEFIAQRQAQKEQVCECDTSDCANEPDLEFQLRRSIEMAEERKTGGEAA